jgi:hypothetical protein
MPEHASVEPVESSPQSDAGAEPGDDTTPPTSGESHDAASTDGDAGEVTAAAD